MKVGVCLKQVPATDSRIQVKDPAAGVDTSDVKWEINPYDEFALEEALKLKDDKKASEVVIFTFGDKAAEAKIRDGLARGADRAVRIDDPALQGSDALGIARALAAAAKKEGVDILFCGKQAVDDDQAQVPAMVAELLGWPQVLAVDHIDYGDGSLRARRPAGGGATEVVEAPLPVVISCDKGLNEPRYASLRGIMMAKKKKIAVLGVGDLGLDPSQVGAAAAMVAESNWSEPPPRPPGRILEGDTPQVVAELVRLLREEAKVI